MSFSTMRASAWVADIKTQLAHVAPLLFTIAIKGTLAAVVQDQEQKHQDEGLLERDVVHIQVLAKSGPKMGVWQVLKYRPIEPTLPPRSRKFCSLVASSPFDMEQICRCGRSSRPVRRNNGCARDRRLL
jgi:hypothetical protein